MTTGESYLPNSVQWQWIPTTSRDSSASDSSYVQSTVTNEDGGIVTPKEAHSFCTTQHWSPINKHQIVLFVCVDRDFDWGGGRAYSTAEYNFIPSPSSDPRYSANGHHSIHPVQPDWLTALVPACLHSFPLVDFMMLCCNGLTINHVYILKPPPQDSSCRLKFFQCSTAAGGGVMATFGWQPEIIAVRVMTMRDLFAEEGSLIIIAIISIYLGTNSNQSSSLLNYAAPERVVP